MKVYEAVLRRRSIRRFKQKKIPLNILKKIVNAARLAPSGANLQPCEYLIVNKPEILKSVFATLRWAAYITPLGNPPEGMEPTAYIVVLVNSQIAKYDPGHDTGAAVENMILTAVEEGIGSCWIGSLDRVKLAEIIKIPGHLTIDSVLALGYPGENPVAEEMKDSVKYWKDSKGRLHVPKRKLKDILYYNKYISS